MAGTDHFKLRPMAAAGTFYPRSPGTLKKTLEELFLQAITTEVTPHTKMVLLPHAGYTYSGAVAVRGLKAAGPLEKYQRIILAGPAHKIGFSGIAGAPWNQWETPLGNMKADPNAFQGIKTPKVFKSWSVPHELEHSLEVILPMLQHLNFQGDLVPLVFGDVDPVDGADILDVLAAKDTLVIVSSDLSHFHPYSKARELDLALIDLILGGNVEPALEGEACGRIPLVSAMILANRRKWAGHLIDYKNSGDTGGDYSRVVGYTSLVWTDND